MELVVLIVIILAVIAIVSVVAAIFAFLAWRKDGDNTKHADDIASLGGMVKEIGDKISQLQGKMGDLDKIPETLRKDMKSMRDETNTSLTGMRQELEGKSEGLRKEVTKQIEDMRDKIRTDIDAFRGESTKALETIRKDTGDKLDKIREGNEKKLEQMRKTVDEKLEDTLNKRISQSFKMVNDQLEIVGAGLGKMQSVSESVEGLKKALTSAPTRGAMGEVILKDLLRHALSSSQYQEKVVINPQSREQVDFAIRIPEADGTIRLLPVDSKFPLIDYENYVKALEESDKDTAKKHFESLVRSVKLSAKSIGEKYVLPPHSTDIGIMFLPNEGMYSLIASRPGLTDELHKNYKVRVVGPNNFVAMLDAIRAGLHLFAIGQRSEEVRQVLAATKTQFEKFGGLLEKVKKDLQQGLVKLDEMSGTRTRAIRKALQDVDVMSDSESGELLGLPDKPNGDSGEN